MTRRDEALVEKVIMEDRTVYPIWLNKATGVFSCRDPLGEHDALTGGILSLQREVKQRHEQKDSILTHARQALRRWPGPSERTQKMTDQESSMLGVVYKKLNGHQVVSLSDDEVSEGIILFSQLVRAMEELGPRFELAANALRADLHQLEQYSRARRT